MEPYAPELVDIEENIELVLVEDIPNLPAEEERERHEQVIVAYNDITYYFVVGTAILAVFAVAHLIPGTN